jgi:hypothetical protein
MRIGHLRVGQERPKTQDHSREGDDSHGAPHIAYSHTILWPEASINAPANWLGKQAQIILFPEPEVDFADG